ncbi:MAG: signal peptidase I [Mollicutes bacterium]|nr:signal peptidase I [Mollicutes bacterium]
MKKFMKEYGSYIIIIIVIMLIRTFIATPIKVNGSSMDKTLSHGEIMILDKISSFKRESIVVINKKLDGSYIIKRIIALPGEKISCINGEIFINGKKYNDKYAYSKTNDFDEVILGKDEYFVLGDNRAVSKDSRYLGPINKKYIDGVAKIVLYPPSKLGIVK